MAQSGEQNGQGGWIERGSRFFRNFHAAVAVGALAVEAFIFPHQAAIDAGLEVVAEVEVVHALALGGLHEVAKNRRTNKLQPG